MKKCWLIGIVFCCLSFVSVAQINTKTILITNDTLSIDSLSISPLDFSIKEIEEDQFSVNYAKGQIFIKDNVLMGKTITVSYRTLSVDLDRVYFHKDYNQYVVHAYNTTNPFIYKPESQPFSIIDKDDLQKMGSISRGVSFGNNQDLSVNSNLNLQLSGKVTDNVYILAAITDENIPIQPDGSTNQLQDFDKVFIQLYNNRNKLIVGDFQTKYDKGNYLRYFKKAQGGQFETKTYLNRQDSSKTLTTLVGASLSRGKYARNIFNGTEGNQGPYRLTGANNERFIVVLSGTESVFIDGKQLKRGQEYDYVIDYNTAEITFTANQLITKDKRIVVEFQYTDRNYARTIFQLNEEWKTDRTILRFNVFSEQDLKNQPLLQELSDLQISRLITVGDSLNDAFASSAVPTLYSEEAILYTMIDTLGYDSVFVFSNNIEDSLYAVSFSYVGEGIGHYVQSNSIANGKIFEWVESGGNYEPIILLAAPEQRQMVNLQLSHQLTKTTSVDIEGAISNQDINTFSQNHSEDDLGGAVNTVISNKKKRGESTVTTKVGYEMITGNFRFIERFRKVEFYRDWNLRDITIASFQNRGELGFSYSKKNIGEISYTGGVYVIEENFIGFKNDLNLLSYNENLRADIRGSYLISEGYGLKTEFSRLKSTLIKPLWLIDLGFKNDFENNRKTNLSNEQLNAYSYGFSEWEAFVQTADSLSNNAKVSYGQRLDYSPKNGAFRDSTIGKNISFDFQLVKNPNHTLKTKTTYRTLVLADTSIKGITADSTILNRIEYGVRLFKGAITSNTYYEIGSGLEIKKEFTFIKVPIGQGLYVHNDNNDNGLKELDEFELAPQELLYSADYIKVFVPTADYVKIYKNQFNQTLMIRPKMIWRTNKGIKGFIGRFTDQFSLKMDRKTSQKQALETYNPFILNLEDSILVAQNISLKNVISFNRSSTKFGIDFVLQKMDNKTLLTNGFEQRGRSFYEIKPRWNLSRKLLLKTEYRQGKKELSSDFFSSRNYNIDFTEIIPSFTIQPNMNFRATLNYKYSIKKNNSPVNELATQHKLGVQTKINIVEKGALSGEINYILIDYPYAANSALSFEMLEGLSSGNNATWFISYQRTLANNLQINITYNGRWSETTKVVHVGGIQARAFF